MNKIIIPQIVDSCEYLYLDTFFVCVCVHIGMCLHIDTFTSAKYQQNVCMCIKLLLTYIYTYSMFYYPSYHSQSSNML